MTHTLNFLILFVAIVATLGWLAFVFNYWFNRSGGSFWGFCAWLGTGPGTIGLAIAICADLAA